MKIDITIEEKEMINEALETLAAAKKRAANTEKDGQIKGLREQSYNKAIMLRNKIQSQEILK